MRVRGQLHSGGGSPFRKKLVGQTRMSNSTPVKNGLIPAVVQMMSAWFVLTKRGNGDQTPDPGQWVLVKNPLVGRRVCRGSSRAWGHGKSPGFRWTEGHQGIH